jgi:CheY-like chemotaxis protein
VVNDAMSNMPAEEVGEVEDIDFAEPVMAPPPPRPAPRPPRAAAAAAPGADAVRTLLVVDDEPDVRRLLVRVFAERGYRVLEAEDGEIALQTVQADMPDALILDAMLPKVHGFEIAQRLKGSDRYGHIPIVMVSAVYRGWRFAEDVKANYHVQAYLEKPFKVSDVVDAVTKALSDAPSGRGDVESTSLEAERCLALGLAAYKEGNLETAVGHLLEGTKADPLAYRLRFHLGLLYGKTGRLYDAIQELETVLSMRSTFFPALKNLAVLYQNAGFRNKALEMWERCLAAAPDEETRQSIKRHLVAVL